MQPVQRGVGLLMCQSVHGPLGDDDPVNSPAGISATLGATVHMQHPCTHELTGGYRWSSYPTKK